MSEVDQRITAAREYLDAARRRAVTQLPPSLLMRDLADSRMLLGWLLDVIDGQAAQLAEIRAVLAGFDWEFHDRQLALEAIERIVTGGGR
ncbi:MAG: hypothetical protein ACTHPS_05330 [Streptosporangiaceae bacterium]